MDGQQNTQQER